ncbi:coiled-coil domain-containing protein 17 isoform X2 [Neopelma chrysocephalum]|uniref:coiled-coil domain-containing protein 17 isoform X2 n=1 Tax=Neopelma chrysocephalum TaxID=114329 RepID=UPI000FCD492F|nr:coiled-coil domain-containing protein 17 isoform X2 [Neopelma chrysocephalum]
MGGTLCLWRGRRARQGGHRTPRLWCPNMGTPLSHTIALSFPGSQRLYGDSGDRGGHGGLPWRPCSPPASGPCSARPTPLPGGPQWRYGDPPAPVGTSTPAAPHTPRLVGVQPLLPAEPPVQQGERPQQLVPPQGHQQPPRELLEAHEQQMAEIRARTQQLEQQREGLCRQLAALGAGGAEGPQPEQGELGLGQVLQAPKEQLGQVQVAQHRTTLHLDTLLPPAGPLTAEARALRLSYLRAGGHDPAILDQLLHLQLEATVLEKGTPGLRKGRRMEPPGTGTQGLDAALLAVELENWRLEDEVLALKVRRERRADAGSRVAQRHSEELAQLQAEVGMLRCHAEQTGPRPILPPAVAPPLPPALAVPELFMEPPGPALGPGSPTAHVPHGLPLSPFVALEDPPPAQEPPEQHKPPRRLLEAEGGTPRTHSRLS